MYLRVCVWSFPCLWLSVAAAVSVSLPVPMVVSLSVSTHASGSALFLCLPVPGLSLSLLQSLCVCMSVCVSVSVPLSVSGVCVCVCVCVCVRVCVCLSLTHALLLFLTRAYGKQSWLSRRADTREKSDPQFLPLALSLVRTLSLSHYLFSVLPACTLPHVVQVTLVKPQLST